MLENKKRNTYKNQVENNNESKILKDIIKRVFEHALLKKGMSKDIFDEVINDKNIFDIWKMTIEEAEIYFSDANKRIADILNQASSIMLGHLRIGQPSSSLSGGENIRIKTLKILKTSAKIIGIDEPFKGLNPTEIYQVALFLEKLRRKGKTIVVVDHTEEAFQYFSYNIKLKVEDNYIKIDN